MKNIRMKPTIMLIVSSLLLAISYPDPSTCQDNKTATEPSQLLDMSLEQLMDIEVSVASGKNTNIREAAGIISLVTKDDIRKAGARDLIDVLQMVPGIQLGADVTGVISIGIRGIWAHEGKALLLWDGHELNEILFSTLQFGNHYPVNQIERVEVIRGPGSALYGGNAELAVINIITIDYAENENNGEIVATYGQMQKTYSRRNINVGYGKKQKDLKINSSIFSGQGTRSNKTFSDYYDNSYDMSDSSELNPMLANLDLKYDQLDFKFMYDNYKITQADEYGENLSQAVPVMFQTYLLDLKYKYEITPELKLTPRISYKYQIPWQEKGSSELTGYNYDRRAQRARYALDTEYNPSQDLSLLLGGNLTYDKAEDHVDESYFYNGKSSFSFYDRNLYAQAVYRSILGNITIGGRFNAHQLYRSSFVPRLSITKIIDKLHFKLLASEAFRAPGLENINLAEDLVASGFSGARTIQPEKTRVYEFETGYSFSNKTNLTANIFQTKIKDPIVYFYDPDTEKEGYFNSSQTGTRGLETELKTKKEWGSASLSYSYYQNYQNRTETYSVPGHSSSLLGFAKNLLSANLNLVLTEAINLNTRLNYIGKRYGYTMVDENDNPLLNKVSPDLLLNIYLSSKIETIAGLEVGIGVYNIFGENYRYVQPYNNGHAPIPGLSPEILMQAFYSF